MRIAQAGLMILLVLPVGIISAGQQSQQQQDDSLAAAARHARDQKKSQAKSTKVWDNDNIPTSPGAISVVGGSASASSDVAAPSDTPQGQTPPANAANKSVAASGDKSAIEASLTSSKGQLESLKTDLDILQRKYDLDQQMFLKKPNNTSDKAGAAALDDEKGQVDAKQQEVADAQRKVDDLQAKLSAPSADAPAAKTEQPASAKQ